MKSSKIKGYIFAALAAAAYGTNPAFAVPLYEGGMNPVSVLLFRYGFSIPILAFMLLYRGHSIWLKRMDILPVFILGILMAVSSLTLFESYNYMNSGVASTLLFIYPVIVAITMSVIYHEKFRATTVLCLILMGAGLILMLQPSGDMSISVIGLILVFLSALTYAIYLIMTNVSAHVQHIPTLKLLFWQFLFGTCLYIIVIVVREPLVLPAQSWGWVNLVALAVIPSIISLGLTTVAIHSIGSTPTAILGALEPLTAVVLSVIILRQSMSPREILGGILIMLATTLIVAADPVDKVIVRMRKLFPKR